MHKSFCRHILTRTKTLFGRSLDNNDRASDFVAVYGDSPSVSVKTQGRAPHSIDRGPRAQRSATLDERDEVFCIGVAIIVLYTCNAPGAYDKWSINRVVRLPLSLAEACA